MMTQKVKSNLDELKSYSQRMREINVDIHKKVMALSSLLQIGDTISARSIQIEPLLSLIVERSASVLDTGYGAFYSPAKDGSGIFKAGVLYNLDSEKLTDVTIKKGGHEFLDRILEARAIVTVDKSAKPSKELESFRSAYNVKNFLVIPVYSGRNDLGVLFIGSRIEDLRFKDDDIELLKVFAKQATIAIESDILSKKTDQLAIKDDLTDLYNKTFIMGRLEEEIRRAIFYQRPCSFIVFNIDNFRKFRDTHGELAAEEALKRLAKIFRDNLTPVGKAARIGGDDFAMLLPEKNKKEAGDIAEGLRKKIEGANLLRQGQASLTVSCGVGENPIDGATAEELYKKATAAVKEAKSMGKNRVVV
ncbi:MAG: sensor domain-containing diguanylate cyclase [Candidatus Omnitrophica bacterium]|nr:sensor domain-containing diguanylate cyclase [Candidatus Omnitrophota bacterium]